MVKTKVGEQIGEQIGDSPTFLRGHITKIPNMTGNFHEVGILWYITDIMLSRHSIVVGLNGLTSWHWHKNAPGYAIFTSSWGVMTSTLTLFSVASILLSIFCVGRPM